MWPQMTSGHSFFNEKKRLFNVQASISSFDMIRFWTKNIEKVFFWIKKSYYVTFNEKNCISIHRNFHQNRFVKECARKKKAKIPELRLTS